ncbi:MAG: hypothetical protein IV094_23965 [Vitreoscilla sp.]|nr:hypothetical protein [Vitreoscilla sp.]
MYEPKHTPPIPTKSFLRRLLVHLAAALALFAGSLAIGMLGYMACEGLPWVDAFLNASMLLGGMGPVDPPQYTAGKLFAGFYALYAGLVFMATAALLFAPVFHRLIHSFHWSEKV